MSDRVNLPLQRILDGGLEVDTVTGNPTDNHIVQAVTGRSRLLVTGVTGSPVEVKVLADYHRGGSELEDLVKTVGVGETAIIPLDPTTRARKSGDDRGAVYVDVDTSTCELAAFNG